MGRKREEDKAEVPLSSLIDIVFLLLMFFIATAEEEKEAFEGEVKLARAKNMPAVTTIPATLFPVLIEKNGEIKCGGRVLSVEGCFELLKSHRARYGNECSVVIRADKEASLKYTEQVMDAAVRAQLPSVKICAELRDDE